MISRLQRPLYSQVRLQTLPKNTPQKLLKDLEERNLACTVRDAKRSWKPVHLDCVFRSVPWGVVSQGASRSGIEGWAEAVRGLPEGVGLTGTSSAVSTLRTICRTLTGWPFSTMGRLKRAAQEWCRAELRREEGRDTPQGVPLRSPTRLPTIRRLMTGGAPSRSTRRGVLRRRTFCPRSEPRWSPTLRLVRLRTGTMAPQKSPPCTDPTRTEAELSQTRNRLGCPSQASRHCKPRPNRAESSPESRLEGGLCFE